MKVKMNDCQKRFWLNAMLQRDNSDHVAYVYRVRGKFYTAVFRKALGLVVEETEAFHAVYREEKGELLMFTDEGGPLEVEVLRETDPVRCEDLLKAFGQRLFYLEKEWPLRVCMIQQTDSCFWLEFVFHHICVEASSIGMFFNRLSEVYEALLTGEKAKVVTVPLLSEYLKQEACFCGRKGEGLAYWERFFEHAPLGIVFCCDRMGKQEDEAGCLDFQPGRRLQRRMEKLAVDLHTTVFRVWMSAWLWILAFYSGSRRVVVSYPVNVCPASFRGVAGPWVNNLACEGEIEGNPSFTETLESCGRQRREVRDFQMVLITDIADRLKRSGRLCDGDLFLNAGINYAAWGRMQKLQFGEIQAEFWGRVPMKPQFDLLLEVEPEGNCRIVYRKDFQEKRIRRMMRSLILLLRQVCEQPYLRFSEVSFIPQREIRRMIQRSDLPEKNPREEFRDFLSCFRETAVREAKRPAILLGEEMIGYGELEEISTQIGRGIRQVYRSWKKTELLRGLPVGICLPRDNRYIAVILGVMKAGGTYVPLDPAYPDERLSFMAEDCGMELIVISRSLKKRVKGVKYIYPEDLPVEVEAEQFPEVKPDDVAYVIYTSGTSGRPKGVPVTYLNLFCVIRNFIECFRLKPGVVQLHFSNIGFDASVMELFPVLVAGATICIALDEERYDPQRLAKRIREKGVTVAYIPPGMLAQIRENLPGLRTLMVAGEPTPAEVVARWRRGRRLLNGYGPTENTILTTYGRFGKRTAANDIGKPWEGVSCYVLDEYRRLVPDGVPGELWTGGWQLTKGYIRRPELNREKFMENPFAGSVTKAFNGVLYRTGDIVRRLPNGDLLFMGRCDFQVKIRGFRIELGEVENCLGRLTGVIQVLVTVAESEGMKRLIAYLQCEPTAGITEVEIRKYLGKNLPEYMVPSAFVMMDSFPMTANGKIDRKALPAPVWNRNEYIAPVTREEDILVEVACRILKMGKIGAEDDLFALGLSSLSAMELVAEAEKEGVGLSVSTVYRERTIRRMGDRVKNRVYSWYKNIPGRRVVVLVSGHMDFGALLRNVAEPLSREYSVLVLESFHDYAEKLPEELTFGNVVAFYVRLLEDILPAEEGVFAFAGHCLGGELAYALAVDWAEKRKCRPWVWLFNALARRKLPLEWMKTGKLHTEAERFVWKVALKKKELTDRLVATEELPFYDGRVILFVPDCFTRHLVSPELPAPAEGETVKCFREMYGENPGWWKELVPDLQVCQVKGDHWSMLSSEGVETIMEQLKSEINVTEI